MIFQIFVFLLEICIATQTVINDIVSSIVSGGLYPNCRAPTIGKSQTLEVTGCGTTFAVHTDSNSNVYNMFLV